MTTEVESFITRWSKATGSELANAQLFVSELCALLALEAPHPASDDVLDPACGSGNFLYVTLEHMKRLEGEVLNQLEAFGDTQALIEGEGLTVDPHQFLGIEINTRAAATMRQALGDGYTEALRATWKAVPESADFVMYWWHHAAEEVRAGRTRRFGLITTNSLRQTFNRRVIEAQLEATAPYPLALKFAVPDHPWVDSAGGAAVRIAMTVGVARTAETTAGELKLVVSETQSGEDAREVVFETQRGTINADLTVGANVAGAVALSANTAISTPGVKLHGSGFIVTREEAQRLGLTSDPQTKKHLREYRNGRDLTERPRDVLVIDLLGLTEPEARKKFPLLYQRVLSFVKPEREQNNRESYRKNWWVFGEPRKEMRPALQDLHRYGRNRQAPHIPVFGSGDSAGQHADRNCNQRCVSFRRVVLVRSCCVGVGGRWAAWRRKRSPLQQNPLFRNLPFPHHHAFATIPHPPARRRARRPS